MPKTISSYTVLADILMNRALELDKAGHGELATASLEVAMRVMEMEYEDAEVKPDAIAGVAAGKKVAP